MNDNEALRKDILVRLRKIEGQVKGIQGMVEKDVCCRDVLTQISAFENVNEQLDEALGVLKKHISQERVEQYKDLVAKGDYKKVALELNRK